ncbi:adenylosuccinate synthase [Paenibacillus allorhizosphaerae]|uniref:Adenylosuccinate synthetase n=1 Tax=Paenibacillus allorhizosphaerae TaxID=2849866 RepID=A0ABN7TG98_9BACL|nr:adenylosuccinate synthase [Paenibacillus allorhizosphaerae]CAG7629349.1 Adenylosuccinate synthetase [Paenibacillus allorhizosphaerae]
MSVTAIVGANWGDEGKGKITDALAAEAHVVVRYQGGSNAGHTIINDYGKFSLHLLPSGVFHPHITNVIGPGVALNVSELVAELDALEARGVPKPKLRISDRVQLVLPFHMQFDRLEEERLGARSFGSTRKGIAPFYADKYAKLGIQAGELADPVRLKEWIESAVSAKNVLLTHRYGEAPIETEALVAQLLSEGERLRPYLCDTTEMLHEALGRKERILVEGQLGALRDPDHGIYPFSTSSSTLAGFAAVGAGLPPYSIDRIVAVVKAYSSCVGTGPFVTELLGESGDELRARGGDAGEYGATTGRPRRVGWFDAVATRYGCQVQGATEVALTNLDVLGYLDEIPICIGYRIDGVVTERFPVTVKLDRAEPVYATLPGWKEDLSGVRSFADLPEQAKAYVQAIEERIGVQIRTISVGPKRDQMFRN